MFFLICFMTWLWNLYFKSFVILKYYNQACNKCVDIAEIIEYFRQFIHLKNDNLNIKVFMVLEPKLGFETTLEVEWKFSNTLDSLSWNKPQPPQA